MAEIAGEVGYSGLTVGAIVQRAGASKPSFYRRFPNPASAVPAVLAAKFGVDSDVDTGSVVSDLLEIQVRQCRLFNDPITRNALAGYLDAMMRSPEDRDRYVREYLAPRRSHTAVVLDRAAERGEIAPYGDSDFVADLLTGPAILQGLLPGLPPIGRSLIFKTVNTTLNEIGYRGDRAALDHIEFAEW